MVKFEVVRMAVLKTAIEMSARGLVVAKAGNVSQRVKQDNAPDLVAITPTSRYYDSLQAADIPIIDFEGKIVDGSLLPSSETRLHLAIYKARADVGAIVHTHSVHASALAVAGHGIPAILEEEVAVLGGEVVLAEYARTGTQQLANAVVMALGDREAALLSNHGAVGVGVTLREALDSAILLERAAQIFLLSLSAGGARALSGDDVAAVRATYLRS
jgi:L-fuculose-phosphate aldolase